MVVEDGASSDLIQYLCSEDEESDEDEEAESGAEGEEEEDGFEKIKSAKEKKKVCLPTLCGVTLNLLSRCLFESGAVIKLCLLALLCWMRT